MKKLFIFFLFLTFLISSSSAYAESKTLTVSEDTYSNEAYPTKLNGSFGSIIVSNHPIWRIGYLKFPFPDLPEDAEIEKITLKFYVYEKNYTEDALLKIGLIASNWSESSLTFDNNPSTWANEIIHAAINLNEGWKIIDLTRLFEYDIHDRLIYEAWRNNDIFGFYVAPRNFANSELIIDDLAFTFRSKEAPNFGKPNQPAELTFEYSLPPTSSPDPTNSPTPTPTVELSSPTSSSTTSTSEEAAGTSEAEEDEQKPSPTTTVEKQEKKLPSMILLFAFIAALLGSLVGMILLLLAKNRKKSKSPKKESKNKSKK